MKRDEIVGEALGQFPQGFEADAAKDSLPSLMLQAAVTQFHIQPLLPLAIEVLFGSPDHHLRRHAKLAREEA